MLSLFFEQLKEGILSRRVKQLECEVKELTERVDKLSDALIKTQNVLAQIATAQAEFITEFEALIRSVQSSFDTSPTRVIATKKGPDAWH